MLIQEFKPIINVLFYQVTFDILETTCRFDYKVQYLINQLRNIVSSICTPNRHSRWLNYRNTYQAEILWSYAGKMPQWFVIVSSCNSWKKAENINPSNLKNKTSVKLWEWCKWCEIHRWQISRTSLWPTSAAPWSPNHGHFWPSILAALLGASFVSPRQTTGHQHTGPFSFDI